MEESDFDAALKLLADVDRRNVVDQLRDQERVEIENNGGDLIVKLAHNHLPKLAERGYVSYTINDKGAVVERGPQWGKLLDLLEVVEGTDLYEQA